LGKEENINSDENRIKWEIYSCPLKSTGIHSEMTIVSVFGIQNLNEREIL
jgi:hypothetical protein